MVTALTRHSEGARSMEAGSEPSNRAGHAGAWSHGLGPGMLLGDYAIVSQVSDNPLVLTYEAVRLQTGRAVALQVLGPVWQRAPNLQRQWRHWANSVRSARHPGLAACDGAGVTGDGLAYVAFEWLRGKTLRQRLDADRLSAPEALALLCQILDALDAAHTQGLVHGDLRPENVFCCDGGSIRLLNVGLSECARSLQVDDDESLLVSAAYVSPEQIAGEAATVRSDLYAFGLMAHECLLGRHPLVREETWPTAGDFIWRQLERRPTPLEGLPAALSATLARAVHKSPGKRPTSAEALLADLRAILAPRAIRAPQNRVAGMLPGRRQRLGAGSTSRGVSQSFEPWVERLPRRRLKLGMPGWPYGHMILGAILGIAAGVGVYLWQTRSAPHGSEGAPSRARDVSQLRGAER